MREVTRNGSVSPLKGLAVTFGNLGDVLSKINQEQYTAKTVMSLGSSIGGHVRHMADHVRALLAGIDGGLINYDDRERDTDVENDRDAGMKVVEELGTRLEGLDNDNLDRAIDVRLMVDGHGHSILARSTIGRECCFVQSHTIHHCAILRMILKGIGIDMAEEFGTAPATLSYHHEAG